MRRISDLLDGFPEDTIQLSETSPLSAERIKQLTMGKVPGKKRYKAKILPKLLAAMIAVSILAVTAVAAEYVWGVRDWFGLVFDSRAEQVRRSQEKYLVSGQLQGVVTQQHLDIIESMGQVKNQSITSEGSTITLMAVCSDEYLMHLYFEIEAPEAVVLPDDVDYSFEAPKTIGYYGGRKRRYITVVDKTKKLGTTSMSLQALPDEDPGDNKKSFHLIITSTSHVNERTTTLNDGVRKILNIHGLYSVEKDAFGSQAEKKQLLFEGDFDFDITNETESRRVEVPVKGITYDVTTTHYPDWKEPVEMTRTVTAESLRIGPLSAEWTQSGQDWGAGHFEIFTKDGNKAIVAGGVYNHGWEGKYVEIRHFYLPVDITQIDYVLINGTEKVYVDP